MEQHGEVGKINISASTYSLIRDDYECVHRGKIEVKSKGGIDMYFVGEALPANCIIPTEKTVYKVEFP